MISFFAKKPFLGNAYPKIAKGLSIWRLSSEIRGQQMAEYLGGKFNPKEREGVCVWLKPNSLDCVKDEDYVDYLDSSNAEEFNLKLKERPQIRVIAHAQYAFDYLKNKISNPLICIPQQHLNWEEAVNPTHKLKVAGYIGRPSDISYAINKEAAEVLKQIGIDYILCYDWQKREDAVKFYQSIDLLVMVYERTGLYDTPFTTPTKMINAASFGVPSLAYPKKGYQEFEGYYVPVRNNEELVREVEKFKDPDYYAEFSKRIQEKAKEYHISQIAKLYKKL